MTKRDTLIATLTLALFAGAAGPAVAACAATAPTVEVVFESTFEEPRLDHRLGRREIASLARKAGGRYREDTGRHFAGLTHGTYRSEIRADVAVMPQPGGGACVWLTKVLGTVRYEGLTVYVDKAYQSGSCPYREVVAHENEHVAIVRGVFRRYLPALKARLEAAARGLKPFRVAKTDRAAQEAVQRLQGKLAPLLDAMDREMRRGHAAIDTDANYERIGARCASW